MKIFIDSGHNYQGADTGAIAGGVREQDITFKIADKLRVLLESNGYSVKMSRNSIEESLGSSVSESLKKRCDLSNAWGADLFVSIHCNAGGGKGTETYVYSDKGKAYDTAKRVNSAIVNKLNLADRGVKVSKALYVLKHTVSPAMLIETAFIDNESDRQKLTLRQSEFAEAIYEGITGNTIYKEVTEEENIVSEFKKRGIITDEALWISKFSDDRNSYFLAKKTLDYMMKRGI